jgi:hypothetical protein
MGALSGAARAAEGAAGGAASGASRAASGGVSTGVVAVLATLPVIGTTLTAIFAADTAGDAIQALIDNPAALAVVGGLALMLFIK